MRRTASLALATAAARCVRSPGQRSIEGQAPGWGWRAPRTIAGVTAWTGADASPGATLLLPTHHAPSSTLRELGTHASANPPTRSASSYRS